METDIQRQVKLSYQRRCLEVKLPSILHYLFQKSLKISKQIRSAFEGKKVQTLPQIIWQTAHFFLKELTNSSILFVGFSQTNRQIYSYFTQKGSSNCSFASRYPSTQTFCKEEKAGYLSWKEAHLFFSYDLVIIASANQKSQISYSDYQKSAQKSSLIFDLSVPRIVDPQISTLPSVNLFNIDKLKGVLSKDVEMTKNFFSMKKW